MITRHQLPPAPPRHRTTTTRPYSLWLVFWVVMAGTMVAEVLWYWIEHYLAPMAAAAVMGT